MAKSVAKKKTAAKPKEKKEYEPMTPQLKFRIMAKYIKDGDNLNQLATTFNVHPQQVKRLINSDKEREDFWEAAIREKVEITRSLNYEEDQAISLLYQVSMRELHDRLVNEPYKITTPDLINIIKTTHGILFRNDKIFNALGSGDAETKNYFMQFNTTIKNGE